MPCRRQDGDEARLQSAEPRTSGVVGNTGVTAEGREVDLLRRPSGGQRDERPEGVEIADLFHLPDIALDVRRDVVGIPADRVEVTVVNAGIPSAKDIEPEVRLPLLALAPLFEREGQEVENGRPSRERLADRFIGQKLLRAGQDE